MDKNKAVVSVHGREYTIVGSEPPEYMQRVAAYVDRRMSELSFSSYLSDERLMALTALNLADELLKSKDEVSAIRKELTLMRQALHKAELEAKKSDKKEP
jgi:cell division protein ZapA